MRKVKKRERVEDVPYWIGQGVCLTVEAQEIYKDQVGEPTSVFRVAGINARNETVGLVYDEFYCTGGYPIFSEGRVEALVMAAWVGWDEVYAAESLEWKFVQKVLPEDIVQMLRGFRGIEKIRMRSEVRESVLAELKSKGERLGLGVWQEQEGGR